jgi:hypothetical protein
MESGQASGASRPAGWFPPGVSGNPGGRPKRSELDKLTVKLTRATALAAVERLLSKAVDVVEKSLRSKDQQIALRAALEVLDRSVGKAVTRIEGTLTAGEPVVQVTPELLQAAARRLLAASAVDAQEIQR